MPIKRKVYCTKPIDSQGAARHESKIAHLETPVEGQISLVSLQTPICSGSRSICGTLISQDQSIGLIAELAVKNLVTQPLLGSSTVLSVINFVRQNAKNGKPVSLWRISFGCHKFAFPCSNHIQTVYPVVGG